jgi:hypothetical protein
MPFIIQEEFEDTKGVVRIRISTKNRQHNGQRIKYKRKNNDLQSIRIKHRHVFHSKNIYPLLFLTSR